MKEPRPCGSCGRFVLDLTHERTQKPAPIDAEPVPHGGTILVDREAGTYRILTKQERADRMIVTPTGIPPDPLHRPHFATCPQADHWRGKR